MIISEIDTRLLVRISLLTWSVNFLVEQGEVKSLELNILEVIEFAVVS